jgi:hypothetical protein
MLLLLFGQHFTAISSPCSLGPADADGAEVGSGFQHVGDAGRDARDTTCEFVVNSSRTPAHHETALVFDALPGMSFSPDQAYKRIKQLEADGTLPLPKPQATVTLGTLNASTRKFTFSVPTTTQTEIIPPERGGPNKPTKISTEVGLVLTKAVDLVLRINITNPVAGITARVEGGLPIGLAPGKNHILLDIGTRNSEMLPKLPPSQEAQQPKPPLSTIGVFLSGPGIDIHLELFVLRPAILGAGAFTIPALPVALIYAPPQGKLKKNFSQYTETHTLSRAITTSVSSSSSTKVSQAFTAAELIGKIASAVNNTLTLYSASRIQTTSQAKAADETLKEIKAFTGLVSDLLSAVDTTTTTTITVSNSDITHQLTVQDTDSTSFGTPAGLGPGVGDRMIFLRNVRVLWTAFQGVVDISVLGAEGSRSVTVQGLIQDRDSLAAGGNAKNTNLDAASIEMLLSLDPFVANPKPVLGAPRFVPADPPNRAGFGTSPQGDQISVSHQVTVEDKRTTTAIKTKITEFRPGWLSALFGSDQTRQDTVTFGYTSSISDKVDDKISDTATFFSAGPEDPYNVDMFFDRLFGTLAFAPSATVFLQVPVFSAAGTQ